MKKRNLFTELTEGFDALSDARAGEQNLGTHEVNVQPLPDMSAVKPLAAVGQQCDSG
jgi:putative transcriptional regulator